MHPVDRYKQYVFDPFLVVVVSRHCRERQQNAGNSGTEHHGCAPESSVPRTEESERVV
jgi:hypothetical protein